MFEIAEAIEAVAEVLCTVDLVVAHSLRALSTAIAAQGSLQTHRVAFVAPAVRPRHLLEVLGRRVRLSRRIIRHISDEMKLRFGDDIWDRMTRQMTALRPGAGAIVVGLEDTMVLFDDSRDVARDWSVPFVEINSDHDGVLRLGPALDEVLD